MAITCPIHNVEFFKRGSMKGYAHPIKDAEGNQVKDESGKDAWCNMKDALPDAKEAPQHPTEGVPEKDLPPVNPQAIGMTTKEIGDMIRARGLILIFGTEASTALVVWYRGQILGNTRIQFDGAKLPQFKKEE